MTEHPSETIHLTPDQVARFGAAARATDDPNALMDEATDLFVAMEALVRRGDRVAAAGAEVEVGDTCLRLCGARATSAAEAEDKAGFLAIIVRWAWPRHPAIGAALDAARRAEQEAWGLG